LASAERASEADDLRVRAAAAEKRLESAAREGARAVAKARDEASRWRAEASALRAALEDAEDRAASASRRAARADAAAASSGAASGTASDAASDAVDAERPRFPSATASPPAPPSTRPRNLEGREGTAYDLPPKLPPSPEGVDAVRGAGAAYAATYHARSFSPPSFGVASFGAAKSPRAPAKLTAEFLDALGSRLSSVRDLLTAPHEPGNAPGTG
jgi:hypothetical protein